jgi:hypothetical protein
MKSPAQASTTSLLFHLVCTLFAAVAGLAPGHAAPPGKCQQMTSPDAVPQGLAKSDWQSIRAAYEAGRHEFQPIEGGHWQARNPGQQWTTRFDGRGFIATPHERGKDVAGLDAALAEARKLAAAT